MVAVRLPKRRTPVAALRLDRAEGGVDRCYGRPRTAQRPLDTRNHALRPSKSDVGRRKTGQLVVFTIGHSTRPIAKFIRLLKAHGVQRVIDVRTIPRSRHNPQFNRTRLSPALHSARIHYRHTPGLGGLRHARRDSTNTAWRNASFCGYADYMQTSEFGDSLDQCIALAKRERVVLMCAEAVRGAVIVR